MKLRIVIIGGGTAGLSFASKINTEKYDVLLFDRKKRLGSKLLVAGKGGFNLSHAEPFEDLVLRYTPQNFLIPALTYFDNIELRKYYQKLGIPTFIGSSNRIFPKKPIKPIEVVNAIQNTIETRNVSVIHDHFWTGIQSHGNGYEVSFTNNKGNTSYYSDIVVFALGGASWSVTGSDGTWLESFSKLGIATSSFQPSNCAVKVLWPVNMIGKLEGIPLKNISVRCDLDFHLGEIMITKFGLEGTPIYALSKLFRKHINQSNTVDVFIDLKPNVSTEVLHQKISKSRSGSWSNHVEKTLNLSKAKMIFLKNHTTKDEFQSPQKLIQAIKHLKITATGLAPIDEAISTVGGISCQEVNENFELLAHKNVFILGEMLDWDAPTGGYLIQGCMSMGQYLGNYLNLKD